MSRFKTTIFYELVAFVLFVLASCFINGNKRYFALLIVYFIILLYKNKDIIRSLWLVYLSSFLFERVLVLIVDYPVAEDVLSRLASKNITMNFAFYFSDIFLVVLSILLVNRKVKIDFGRRDIFVTLLAVVSLIATFFSPAPFYYAWYSFFKFMLYVLTFYVAMIIGKDRDTLKSSLYFIIAFGLINSALIIIQKLHGGPIGLYIEDLTFSFGRYADEMGSLFRPGGISWNANLSSTMLLMVVPVIIHFYKNTKSKVYLLCLGICFLAILLGSSRWVWVVTLVFLIFWLAVYGYLKSKTNKLALFFGIWVIGLPLLWNRLYSLSDASGWVYRLKQYQVSWDIVTTHTFGVGLDYSHYYFIDNFDPEVFGFTFTPAHNFLLELGSGIGWVGFMLGLLAFAFVVKKIMVIGSKDRLSFALICSVGVCMICNMAYTSLFSTNLTRLLCVIWGFYYIVVQLENEEDKV